MLVFAYLPENTTITRLHAYFLSIEPHWTILLSSCGLREEDRSKHWQCHRHIVPVSVFSVFNVHVIVYENGLRIAIMSGLVSYVNTCIHTFKGSQLKCYMYNVHPYTGHYNVAEALGRNRTTPFRCLRPRSRYRGVTSRPQERSNGTNTC